ncbi:MAG: DUF4349 domain-containing protein [Lachnospiraceae bacterium]|nr:DUF4349 domain-containing protein [Lachnospiraceae bacterium]
MKKRFLHVTLIAALMLSGCGAGDKSYDSYVSNGSYQTASAAEAEGGWYADYDYADDMDYNFEAPAAAESAESPAADPTSANGSETSNGLTSDIDREMLVYSCSMDIDTLDFASTVNGFKALLDQYGGFIESENYSDGGSYGRWYSESTEKWQSYSATLRIPSRNYDAFCNSAGNLGDLRSKNASVQNLSSEYHDLSTTLEIYEAKEERYIALLSEITEDEYAVAIERELTDLQIEIARIKSRMNKINTDVSYSYVYITINEVKEYVSEPLKTDTFFDRLLNTINDTWIGFIEFWETLLFLIIRLLPYLVLIALLVIIILALTKKRRARKAQLRQEHAAQAAAQMARMPQMTQAAQTTQAPQMTQAAQTTQAPQTTQTAQTAPVPQAPQSAQAPDAEKNESATETK